MRVPAPDLGGQNPQLSFIVLIHPGLVSPIQEEETQGDCQTESKSSLQIKRLMLMYST
jgi:hypothetical protein